ncbi:MAG: hypothetical protein J6Y65_03145 [Eggerthellaceae bacterium]|nr:hypothetical protein [Eggerthellaceae bacterium]
MKILILSSSTGGGHNSAAKALQAEAKRRGHRADIKNGLDFTTRSRKEFISWGHTFTYKYLPKTYGKAYAREENHPNYSLYSDFMFAAAPLYFYINQNKYDAVVCVHVFPALMLAHILRNREERGRKYNIPGYFVATDYTCSPGVYFTRGKHWFVPKGLTGAFVDEGVDKNAIIESGIPVSKTYYEHPFKQEVKEELGLPTDKRLVVMSCGAMGCGPLNKLSIELDKLLPENSMLAVICGSNKKLLRKLKPMAKEGRFYPMGFVHNMDKWIKAADLIVSKPGGLTSTECVTGNTPCVFIDAVPGPETYNLKYFVERGCAWGAADAAEATSKVLALLDDDEACNAMLEAQKQWSDTCAVDVIIDTLEADYSQNEER